MPKKIERNLTNGLSQNEVQSRLSALANTIDSRGWAVKNVNINLYANPGSMQDSSDRLIDINSLPREVPNYDVQASDDIMDEHSNPIAQQFDHLIEVSTQAHHQQLVNQMNSTAPAQAAEAPADYWFLNQNPQPAALADGQAVFNNPSVITPGAVASPAPVARAPVITDLSEDDFLAKVRADEAKDHITNSHLHTLQPLGSHPGNRTPVAASAPAPQPTPVAAVASPAPTDPAIMSLASNNDLNIATLAREAKKSQDNGQADGEVVISLR